jgi:hypothetical protein
MRHPRDRLNCTRRGEAAGRAFRCFVASRVAPVWRTFFRGFIMTAHRPEL